MAAQFQFMSKIIGALQTTLNTVATKSDDTVTKINDLITALNTKGDAQIAETGSVGADQVAKINDLITAINAKGDAQIVEIGSVGVNQVTKINDLITAFNAKGDAQIAKIGSVGADQVLELGTLQSKTDSMLTKLDTTITKLQGVIDSQYVGELLVEGLSTNTIQYSNSTEESFTMTNHTHEFNSVMVNSTGSMHVSYDVSMYEGAAYEAQILVNGIMVKEDHTMVSNVYETKENIIPITKGDVVSISITSASTISRTYKIKNIVMRYETTTDEIVQS
ncbi:MAG: hypothetical protein JJE29_00435 [Peptostreptococcaceae bacterium]|nr:hypothetical protein [Peptostreptococcaceae bacterium]